MTERDVPLGMRLKDAAGWNQTEADWRRFLALEPGGCFVAEEDGQGVGTVATFVFGPVAWIAMMLVDPAHRCRGIGTALMQHALGHLEQRGVTTVRLDATTMGRPVYEKLGFVAEYELARHEGTAASAGPTRGVVTLDYAILLREAFELDHRVTGTDRAPLLKLLQAEYPNAMRAVLRGGMVRGFLTRRPGSKAVQIGPCVAEDTVTGVALLSDSVTRLADQRVFVDIPLANQPATEWARAAGFMTQRTFIRMCRGTRVADDPTRIWASSGPEKG